MDGKRWSVTYWLALLVCGVVFAGAARATTSDIFATGFTYAVSTDPVAGNTAVLTVSNVLNQTDPPRITGELTLELWAFPTPYPGLGLAGYQQQGYRLASYSLGRLAPGYGLGNVNSGSVPYTPPPVGTWYITSLIVEYDASAINAGGELPRAFFDYAAPLVVAPVADITPVAGLWSDPTQPGTGYSINVRHGVAVIIVYGYGPEGNPRWYIATGPLAGTNPKVFTAPLQTYVGGACTTCPGGQPPVPGPVAGSIFVAFTSPSSATVAMVPPGGTYFVDGRSANIVPASF